MSLATDAVKGIAHVQRPPEKPVVVQFPPTDVQRIADMALADRRLEIIRHDWATNTYIAHWLPEERR